jgi:hypothetical protein
MALDVRFSFADVAQKAEYEAYAEGKGMTLSALAKAALFQYKARYPGASKAPIPKVQQNVRAVQAKPEVLTHEPA